VRADGYATACDELDYGIAALAVPIRDAAGNVLAALNSSGYSGRVKIADMIAERLSELRESAARMSQALARHPALARSLAANAIEWPLRAAE
jgi:IclR family pca regulon transcriptional regulator